MSLDGSEPGQKKLAHRQDELGFSGLEIWVKQDRYIILMDKPDREIDVLPALLSSLVVNSASPRK
jgi:hypothetical protein